MIAEELPLINDSIKWSVLRIGHSLGKLDIYQGPTGGMPYIKLGTNWRDVHFT